MQIRSYQQGDFEAVWELHILALQHVGAYKGSGPWDDDLRCIEERYIENDGVFLVGVLDEQIVAMGAIRKSDNQRAEVKRMRVHPNFQGRGYGKAMLQELERYARMLGYKVLYLDTSTVQITAQNLYRKQGFRETGERREHQGYVDIFFEKHL